MIEILDQAALKVSRTLTSPRDNIDDLVKDMRKNQIKRPLLVRGEGFEVVDGLRRLRALERIGYKGPVACQVIGYNLEAAYELFKYLEDARNDDGVMPFPRIYDIYHEFRDLSMDFRTYNRRSGVKGARFFDLYAEAAGIKPWQFTDYLTFRSRSRGFEDNPTVQRYRRMVDGGEMSATTASLRLGRTGIIDSNLSDTRSVIGVTNAEMTPRQQLKILKNAADQMEGVRTAIVGMGRIHPSIGSYSQPEIRKNIADLRRVLTILLRTIDQNGREEEE